MSNTPTKKTSQAVPSKKAKAQPEQFSIQENTDPYFQAEKMTAAQKEVSDQLLCISNPISFEEYYARIYPAPREPRRKDSLRDARKSNGIGFWKRAWMSVVGFFDEDTAKKKHQLEAKSQSEADKMHQAELNRYHEQVEHYLSARHEVFSAYKNGEREWVERYFQYILEQDSYSVAFDREYQKEILTVKYKKTTKTLTVHSRLPNIEEISVYSHFVFNPEIGCIDGYEYGTGEQKRYRINIARGMALRQAMNILEANKLYDLIETVRVVGYLRYYLGDAAYKVNVMIASFNRNQLNFHIGTDSIEAIFSNQVDAKTSSNIYSLPPAQLAEVHWLKKETLDESAVENE